MSADGSRVYVGSDGGSVYALYTATGAPAWEYKTGGFVYSRPLLTPQAVVFGSGDGRLYALSGQ